ncbi:DUF4382 domain-containing protein [Litoribacter ruber]|uniref:DUF4382 domain-containing protein n=1 Tax=Litoribacter ruber TaxID=702568 RepID=UPI001BD9BD08|nr:DUF4382 domain-containing protein [Litoribacter ruber]MBT0812170.1 DUF4382 domain-containing protein [Litoribacter ruber]
MKLKTLISAFFLPFILASCGQDDERAEGLININLIDAPGDFDQAWVEVLGAEVVINGTAHFVDYVTARKMVNVSDLVNGISLQVGRRTVPVGQMTEITLLMGEEIYVIRNGQRVNMQFLNSDSRRLTLPADLTIEGGLSYDYYIDLDMSRSITRAAAEIYTFDPVGRAFLSRGMTAISGTVLPFQAAPYIFAVREGDTLGTVTNLATGQFQIRGLTQGEYQLLIQPRSGFADTLINFPVFIDSTNALGEINLRAIAP